MVPCRQRVGRNVKTEQRKLWDPFAEVFEQQRRKSLWNAKLRDEEGDTVPFGDGQFNLVVNL